MRKGGMFCGRLGFSGSCDGGNNGLRHVRAITADVQGDGQAVYARATPRIGMPGPQVIGIDEVSIKKGHTYRIVVSDLVRR